MLLLVSMSLPISTLAFTRFVDTNLMENTSPTAPPGAAIAATGANGRRRLVAAATEAAAAAATLEQPWKDETIRASSGTRGSRRMTENLAEGWSNGPGWSPPAGSGTYVHFAAQHCL